jgi:hypothetical protein
LACSRHLLPQVAPDAVLDGMQDVLVQATGNAHVEVDRKFPIDRIGEDLATRRSRCVHSTAGASTARCASSSRCGPRLQEVITYPWTTDHLLAAAGFGKEQTVLFDGAR